MNVKHTEYAQMFKALSDPNRLIILDMLSYGEHCACEILDELKITQPTLSHHMNYLCDCKLVNGRKDGKWMHYSLNEEVLSELQTFLKEASSSKQDHGRRKRNLECNCE